MISTGTNTGQFLCFKFYNILITNRLISVKKLNKVRFPQLKRKTIEESAAFLFNIAGLRSLIKLIF